MENLLLGAAVATSFPFALTAARLSLGALLKAMWRNRNGASEAEKSGAPVFHRRWARRLGALLWTR